MIPIRFLPWLTSIRGMVAISCIIFTCVWFAFSLVGSYTLPPIPTYRADFGKAQWIAPANPRGKAYYRKELYVTGSVRRAWVLATGPGFLSVIVNNTTVRGTSFGSGPTGAVCPTTLVDITAQLKPGTNTLAILQASNIYTLPGSLLLRGAIEYSLDRQEFVSDGSWRASTYPDVLSNLVAWTDPTVEDVHWPLAQVVTFPSPSLIRPVLVPPQLFQDVVKAQWITAFPEISQLAVFTRDFDLPAGFRDGWLQVASVGENLVSINGHTIGDSTIPLSPGKQNVITDIAARNFHYYYLNPWLHSGTNQLSVRVSKYNEAPALLAQVSYQGPSGVLTYAPPNEGWQIKDFEGTARKALYTPTVNDMGAVVGMPMQEDAPSPYVNSATSRAFLYQLFWGSLLSIALFGLHLLVTQRLVRDGAFDRMGAVSLDALLHAPVLLALFFLWMLQGDSHVQPEWPQQSGWFWLILILWLVLRWLAVGELSRPRVVVQEDRWFNAWLSGRGFALALIAITVLSFCMRLPAINRFSIGNDEATLVLEAQGIWDRGYPSKEYHGEVIRASTYELVPYPLALSALIFGWSGWAMRIPSLLFSTFTTFNLARMGRDLFSSRVGLLAGLLHAIIPVNVYWGHDCFHPSQDQFFAVLVFWYFYRSIREPGRLDPLNFMYTCIYMICLYFSWEGAAFVLPTFVLAMLLMNPGRWGWLRQWPLYLGVFVVSTFILVQLGTRSIKVANYLKVGIGLSAKSPGLLFLDPTTDTTFYTSGTLSVPCHLLVDLMFVLGLFYVGRSRPLRYVMFVFSCLLMIYSNLMPIYSSRYFYYYQCLLILGASASMVYLADTLRQLARGEWGMIGRLTATWTTRAAFLFILAMCCQDMGLFLPTQDTTSFYQGYASDVGPACDYIIDHLQPGDTVVGNLNYLYFAHRAPDSNINIVEDAQSIFDPHMGRFGAFEQINYRAPSLLTTRDLTDTFARSRRVWVIAQNPDIAGPDLIKADVNEFLDRHCRLVFSSHLAGVYLGEGFDTRTNQGTPDLELPSSAATDLAKENSTEQVETGVNVALPAPAASQKIP